MKDKIEQSQEIVSKAIEEYQPYATVMALSGGTDSLAAFAAALHLGVPIDFILHGNTRTGIQETTEFVRQLSTKYDSKYIEADAGDSYEKYVLRKGFFGRGQKAHSFAYHILKANHFRKCMSRHIRQRKRGRTILLINGARQDESKNRSKNMTHYFRSDPAQKNNVWVNIIHYWSKEDCFSMIDRIGLPENPVTKKLCRSGECLCGTMQEKEAMQEASYWYPDWGKWLDDLSCRVRQKFPWDWGDNIPKSWSKEKAGQLNMFPEFQPMCNSCLSV